MKNGWAVRAKMERKCQCRHKIIELEYKEGHYDAKRRKKAGEKQRRCLNCRLWIWESHYDKKMKHGTP